MVLRLPLKPPYWVMLQRLLLRAIAQRDMVLRAIMHHKWEHLFLVLLQLLLLKDMLLLVLPVLVM